jgi:transposase
MQVAADLDYRVLYEQKSAAFDQLQLEQLHLRQQLDQLKKMIFGSRQERFVASDVNPAQLSLGIQAEETLGSKVTDAKQNTLSVLSL